MYVLYFLAAIIAALGSLAMTFPSAPDKTGLNDSTKLPHTLSLAEVFDRIRLAPSEIAALLTHFGSVFSGGPQASLQTKLQAASADLLNPETYSDTKTAPLEPGTRVDAQGRAVTPALTQFTPDAPRTFESLNPGMVNAPAAERAFAPSAPARETVAPPAVAFFEHLNEPDVTPNAVPEPDRATTQSVREPDANR